MTEPSGDVWSGLLFNAGLVAERAPLDQVIAEHTSSLEEGASLGPLLVPDTSLAAVDRGVSSLGVGPIDVGVIGTTGAGSIASLAERSYENVTIVGAHSTLRDLDDQAGNVRRVAAAARTLPYEISIWVGLPETPGWESGAEEIEMEGLNAAVHAAGALGVTQMSYLVELDCPFVVADSSAAPIDLASTVLGLVDQTAPVPGWPTDDDAVRVRRRLRGVWVS